MSIKRLIFISLALYAVICVFLYFFANPVVISVIFRLLNFAIMVAIVVYVYYRNLHPAAKEVIHQEELKKEALVTQHDELLDKESELKKKLQDQKNECCYLLTKIDQWRERFDERQKQYENEREKAHERAQKRAQLQSEWLGRNLAYKQIVEHVVEIMREDLKNRFSDEDQQQKYIEQLIVFMRKNVS